MENSDRKTITGNEETVVSTRNKELLKHRLQPPSTFNNISLTNTAQGFILAIGSVRRLITDTNEALACYSALMAEIE